MSRGQDRDQAMPPSEAEPLVGLRRSLASTENGRTGESCEPSWFAVTVQTPARLFPSESLLDVRFVSVAIAAIGSPLARSAMKPRASAMKPRASAMKLEHGRDPLAHSSARFASTPLRIHGRRSRDPARAIATWGTLSRSGHGTADRAVHSRPTAKQLQRCAGLRQDRTLSRIPHDCALDTVKC